jgi:fructose-1,6-bisphosphatase I
MRWVASMVADAPHPHPRRHLHVPDGQQDEGQGGKLRLMYEANPMAMIVEAAGGAARRPRAHPRHPADQLHQRVPVVLGSKNEVERVVRYHLEADDGPAVAHLVAWLPGRRAVAWPCPSPAALLPSAGRQRSAVA